MKIWMEYVRLYICKKHVSVDVDKLLKYQNTHIKNMDGLRGNREGLCMDTIKDTAHHILKNPKKNKEWLLKKEKQ